MVGKMNKNIIIGSIVAILAIATIGIVSADAFVNNGYGWNQANYHNGYGHGYGHGHGYYENGEYGVDVNGPVVQSVNDAITKFEEKTNIDASEENVYQMGRWWVINYTDSDGTIQQGRVDAYTGEVIENSSNSQYQQQYQTRNYDRFHRGGYGCGMWNGY